MCELVIHIFAASSNNSLALRAVYYRKSEPGRHFFIIIILFFYRIFVRKSCYGPDLKKNFKFFTKVAHSFLSKMV